MSYVNIQERRLPFVLRYLSDLITYRHLAWNLVGSDLRARFRRTQLGILWAVLQPLLFALLIALVWGAVREREHFLSFTLYVFSGFTLNEYINNTVAGGQDSLMSGGGFLRQGRIPFLIFQAKPVLTGAFVFSCASIGVFIFAAATGQMPRPGPQLLLWPAMVPVMIFFLLPVSIIMSVIGTLYRDVKHISGLATQALFFMSPIIMPREWIEQPHLRFLEYANPVVPILDMVRAPIIYGNYWDPKSVLIIFLWSVALWAVALIMSANVGRKLVFAV